jgi:hypothetical protein
MLEHDSPPLGLSYFRQYARAPHKADIPLVSLPYSLPLVIGSRGAEETPPPGS